MKSFILLVSVIIATTYSTTLFELELNNSVTPGFEYQFEPYQSTAKAADGTDGDFDVIQFTGLTKYQGIRTKEWLNSTTGFYYITVYFKGQNAKRTGSFIGYERSDRQEVYHCLGLDSPIYMDIHQRFELKSTGSWNQYTAYIELPANVAIKIILEQGSYLGVTDKYDAYFRGLVVNDMTFSDQCPGDDIQMKLAYYTEFFMSNDLEHVVFSDPDSFTMSNTSANSGKGQFVLQFLNSPVPCISTVLYAFDKDDKVINDFPYTHTEVTQGNDIFDTYRYIFSTDEIEKLNCATSQQGCPIVNGDDTCVKYTCPVGLHFYLNKGAETSFSNLTQSYDYTKNNSQAIFNSSFSVIVYEQTSTILNTLVKTREVNAICDGICQLNMSITLELKMKLTEGGTYEVSSKEQTIIWGDYIYFEITSNPDAYYLSLKTVVITTEDNSESLGEDFISVFIKDQVSNAGKLTFKMRASGEAGLAKGKQFNLKFLTLTSLTKDRMLTETANTLDMAQVTGKMSFYAESSTEGSSEKKDENTTNTVETKDEETNTEESASHLIMSVIALLILCFL